MICRDCKTEVEDHPSGLCPSCEPLTPLERAYRLGEGCGGLDAAGVKTLVEMSRENEGNA